MENEIKRKRDIIKNLINRQKTIREVDENYTMPDDFIRGYITGATVGMDFPSHWYKEIIEAVRLQGE